MFVKHFEDEQHHKSAMYYYYYTFSWNILDFLKKQQTNQLSAQWIDTMHSREEYGKTETKLYLNTSKLWEKKKNLWKQISLSVLSHLKHCAFCNAYYLNFKPI